MTATKEKTVGEWVLDSLAPPMIEKVTRAILPVASEVGGEVKVSNPRLGQVGPAWTLTVDVEFVFPPAERWIAEREPQTTKQGRVN